MTTQLALTPMQERVLQIIQDHGPLTGDDLTKRYRRAHGPSFHGPSIRSRRCELTKLGLVTQAPGTGISESRNPAPLWGTPAQIERQS